MVKIAGSNDTTVEGSLTAGKVDELSEISESFLKAQNLSKKEIIRIRLSIETILIRFRERFNEPEIKFYTVARFFGRKIQISVKGERYNPLEYDENGDAWSKNILTNLETMPVYSRLENENVITFNIIRKRKISPVIPLLLVILLGTITGLLCEKLLPLSTKNFISESILTPVCTTYEKVISFCGIPIIFLAVVLGIVALEDMSAFNRIGKKMINHFIAALGIVSLVSVLVGFAVFGISMSGGAGNISVKDITELLLSFLPLNIVTPFANCDAMQLVIMGIIFGIGCLKIAPRANRLVSVLEDTHNLLFLISDWFTPIIPVFIFLILVNCIITGNGIYVLSTWRPFVLTILLQAAYLAVVAARISIKHKVGFFKVIKKVSHTFVIALGTDSCCASYGETYECCEHKLGISNKVFGFGIPIGASVFKPTFAVRFAVLALFSAKLCDVGISSLWLITLFLLSIVFSIAMPAIPGGAMMFYPMLFTQLGIPTSALALAFATDVFYDVFSTAGAQVSVEFALVEQASKLDLLNEDKLRE